MATRWVGTERLFPEWSYDAGNLSKGMVVKFYSGGLTHNFKA